LTVFIFSATNEAGKMNMSASHATDLQGESDRGCQPARSARMASRTALGNCWSYGRRTQ
jgi:hypothetical protein